MNWTIHSIAEFDRLAPTWDVLNEAAGGLPFLHSRFLRPLLQVFGDTSLRLAACDVAGEPQAMGILGRRGFGCWETFQPSQLPLGAWIMRPDQDFERILASLSRKLPGVVLLVGVTQQDPACTARPGESQRLKILDYIQTARVPIAGTFDEYWSRRGKNLRHNMKRQRAKLLQDGVAPHLDVLTRPEDVAAAIAEYGRLESAGWKAGYGTAVHPENDQGRFYRAMLEAFCSAGAGRIYRYRFDQRTVAIDLCIEGGGSLVILKTTYDESIKTISPAFMMREESFRGLFEEGRLQRIEYFGKLMEWHTRWTEDVRTLYHVNYFHSRAALRLRSFAARDAKTDERVTEPQ